MRVTTDDLLGALREAMARPEAEDGLTTKEIMAATGLGQKPVIAWLHAQRAAGRLEVVTVQRADLGGRTQRVVGYRMKKAKRAA